MTETDRLAITSVIDVLEAAANRAYARGDREHGDLFRRAARHLLRDLLTDGHPEGGGGEQT